MIELDNDIVKSGSDAWRQCITLVTQAISTPTTHDKDLLIHKLASSYHLGHACAEHLSICTDSMRDYLGTVRRKENKAIGAYQVLTTNTAFLSELEQQRFRASLEYQIAQIEAVEEEIKTYHPLESPDLLSRYTRTDGPSVIRGIRIRDLAFKRLEELVTALKKRSLIFDDSDDLILHVTENYGNIAGLLERYHELSGENKTLKEEELAFEHDSIAKRRIISVITKSQLAKLVFLLQKELRMQQCIGESLTQKPVIPPGTMDFDELCHPETNTIEFAEREFPTTSDPETIAKIIAAESSEEKLPLLREILAQQGVSNVKMIETIAGLRGNAYAPQHDSFSERELRLWQLHEKFSAQIVDLMQRIDNCYAEADELHRRLLKALAHNESHGNSVGHLYHMYSALQDSHVAVAWLLAHNRTIASHLADMCFVMGQSMLHTSDPVLEQRFRDNIAHLTREKLVAIHMPHPKSDDETASAPRPPRSGSGDTVRGKRRRGKTGHTKEVSLSESMVFRPNPIEASPPSQLVDFMALTQELRRQARGDRHSGYHEVISETTRTTLSALLSDLTAQFRTCQEGMEAGISLARIGSTTVLRRPKQDIEIQVGLRSVTDIATATEAPEPKGKGRPKTTPQAKTRPSRKK
jgi:t-SNARE complex subunit (syntaxin)